MGTNDSKPIPELSPKDIARFWSKVDKRGPDECWPWMGGSKTGEYGRLFINEGRQNVGAHRIAYFLATGIDPVGLQVCHSCDAPICNNPKHLFKGTNLDNAADMVAKGRQATGERSGRHTHPETTARGDRHGLRIHHDVARRIAEGMAARLKEIGHSCAPKLTLDDATMVKARALSGERTLLIARDYRITRRTVQLIAKGEIWKHIA